MGPVRPRAAVISTVGALGIAASAYFDWTPDGMAEIIPLQQLLFVQDVPSDVSYWQSMAAPLVVVGAIGALGALLLSRVVLLIAFLLGLTTAGLWVASQLVDSEAAFSINSVQVGGWVLLGGLVVLLVGLVALRAGGDDDDEDDDIMPFSPLPRTFSGPGASSDDSTTKIGPRPSSSSSSSSSDDPL